MNDDSFRVTEALEAIDVPSASGAVRGNQVCLEALLIPRTARQGSGRNNYHHYDVVMDGEVIVRDAWEPCLEACRVLRNRGITGSITFLDSKTLKPRLTIPDIESGAGLTVRETPLGFAKWQPFHLGANHE